MARSPKAQATRERILRAADELFYLHGYNATGLDRIIREAGVTKGNFYYHFESKEALALATLDWHFEKGADEMAGKALKSRRSPRAKLLAILDHMAGRQKVQHKAGRICGCYFGNFTLEMSAESERMRKKVQEIFQRYRILFRDLIEQAAAAGEVGPSVDPDRTAGMILALMEGAILLDKAAQRPKAVADAVRFIRQYLKG